VLAEVVWTLRTTSLERLQIAAPCVVSQPNHVGFSDQDHLNARAQGDGEAGGDFADALIIARAQGLDAAQRSSPSTSIWAPATGFRDQAEMSRKRLEDNRTVRDWLCGDRGVVGDAHNHVAVLCFGDD